MDYTKKNIVFIGLMGSGKSTVSKALSKILKRKRISIDEMIEKKEGRIIAKIFKEKGQKYFRRLEKRFVKSAARHKGVIIDCGGGAVVDPESMEALKKNGVLIYLKTSARVIYERIKDKKNRPLLNVTNPEREIHKLLRLRRDIYGQADIKIKTDGYSVKEVCTRILKNLRRYLIKGIREKS